MRAKSRAIVIGGSIAGMLTARVLSRRFDEVTIIERDRLPKGNQHRAGVPQSHHSHALLGRGAQLLDQFFPGLLDDWNQQGINLGDGGSLMDLYLKSGRAPRIPVGIDYYAASRPLVEGAVRRRVIALPNVRVMQRMDVIDLYMDEGHNRVGGVVVRRRGTHEAEVVMTADLVVDASGRHSKTAQFLENHAYGPVPKTEIEASGAYATRLYKTPPSMIEQPSIPWVLMQAPHLPRSGVILPIEGGKMTVTLSGTDGTFPPTDEIGFERFAQSLPYPIIHDIMKNATPIGSIHGYRGLANRIWHYERMRRFPQGLIVLGDAFIALNPVYGQGMTAAAMSAHALSTVLARKSSLTNIGDRAHRRIKNALMPFFVLASGQDLRWKTVQGATATRADRIKNAYLDHLMNIMPTDERAFKAFVNVQHGMATTTALFQPGIVRGVMASMLQSRSKPPPHAIYDTGEVRLL